MCVIRFVPLGSFLVPLGGFFSQPDILFILLDSLFIPLGRFFGGRRRNHLSPTESIKLLKTSGSPESNSIYSPVEGCINPSFFACRH